MKSSSQVLPDNSSAPHPDRSAPFPGIEVRNGLRAPAQRTPPLSAEEWADDFFSRAPQYRTKAHLIEIIRQAQRGAEPKASLFGGSNIDYARGQF